mmetsp:Transcript_97992/g.165141  ORF Transcript_97992/g.165141 Transcript_97992/m.165141 type:complete len:91 (-) Transcript_97992:140-412(-)
MMLQALSLRSMETSLEAMQTTIHHWQRSIIGNSSRNPKDPVPRKGVDGIPVKGVALAQPPTQQCPKPGVCVRATTFCNPPPASGPHTWCC